MKIIVLHKSYGCDSGCCGHVIEVDGQSVGRFEFGHPDNDCDALAWAKNMVAEQLGEDHVKDLCWEECVVSDF